MRDEMKEKYEFLINFFDDKYEKLQIVASNLETL